MKHFNTRTLHMLEDHVDERSYEFFMFDYQGKKTWNSQAEGAKPTLTIDARSSGGSIVCGYCGRKALPIQNHILRVMGHCCVCKDAMDQLEIENEEEKVKEEMEKLLDKLREVKPKLNKEILKLTMQEVMKEEIRRMENGFFSTNENRFGIQINNGEDYVEED